MTRVNENKTKANNILIRKILYMPPESILFIDNKNTNNTNSTNSVSISKKRFLIWIVLFIFDF